MLREWENTKTYIHTHRQRQRLRERKTMSLREKEISCLNDRKYSALRTDCIYVPRIFLTYISVCNKSDEKRGHNSEREQVGYIGKYGWKK